MTSCMRVSCNITIHPERVDKHTCRKLTNGDWLPRPVADRHGLDDP